MFKYLIIDKYTDKTILVEDNLAEEVEKHFNDNYSIDYLDEFNQNILIFKLSKVKYEAVAQKFTLKIVK